MYPKYIVIMCVGKSGRLCVDVEGYFLEDMCGECAGWEILCGNLASERFLNLVVCCEEGSLC